MLYSVIALISFFIFGFIFGFFLACKAVSELAKENRCYIKDKKGVWYPKNPTQ
jgi:uncharacterized protein YneF (UPF0154 family)